MRTRILTVLIGITLCLTMIFGLLPACGGGEIQPTGTGAPPATGEVMRWRYQCIQNAGTATYWQEQELCKRIEISSGGRLIIDVQPGGAIVGTMEILDAVATGAIEMGSSCDCYWQGKSQLFNIIGMIPAHFTYDEAICYYYADQTEGLKDAEALFEKFNVHRIQGQNSIPEVGCNSRKKVVNASDYKGLTFRGVGYSALIIQEPEFGGSGVVMSIGDVYTSLQTGVIDACELGNPFSNWTFGLQEVTKYWTFPGMHQLSQTGSILVNLDLWNKLPADIKNIMQAEVAFNMLRQTAFNWIESAKIVDPNNPKSVQRANGIELVRYTPDAQLTFKTVSWRMADAYGAKDPAFAKMWNKMKDFMTMMQNYNALQTVTYPAAK